MRGIVPADLLVRYSKGHYNADVYADLARHLPTIHNLFHDGLLARRGLIEPGRLADALRLPLPRATSAAMVMASVGCERWLQARTP